MFINIRSLILVYIVTFSLFTSLSIAVDSGGIVEGCSENEVAFGCKEEGTVVAIKEAWLHDGILRVPKYKCHIPEYNVQFKKGSVLQHINKKCALQRACYFDVWNDVPGARQDESSWRGHVIRVNYECVKEDIFIRTCGEKIEAQEGWLQNVGYPKYYLGPGACTFTLAVDPGQKVNLQIFDLSTRDIVRPAESECQDYLAVTEGSRQLVTECGDPNRPISVTSQDNILNVTLHTSGNVYPKRGFVAYFKAVGCQTPPIPEDGYLSHRNESHAEFWCCVRHVFSDTMDRVRTLTCQYKQQWDRQLVDCVDLDDLLSSGNITEDQYWRYNGSVSASFFYMKEEVVYDIVLPGIIMTVLILGNVGILFLILLCRRRAISDPEDFDEMKSIKENAEPTDTIEKIPCRV